MGLIEVRDFSLRGWLEPDRAKERACRYCERMEEGNILFFAQTPFPLPEGDRSFLLNVRQTSSTVHKNISYKPDRDQVTACQRGMRMERDSFRLCALILSRSQPLFANFFLPIGIDGIWILQAIAQSRRRAGTFRSRNAMTCFTSILSLRARPMAIGFCACSPI